MRSGPPQINIGWLLLSRMRTAVRRLCGQASGFPSGVADQSYSRVSAPISPPPARKSAEVGRLIFNIGDRSVASSAQLSAGNLAACHTPSKRVDPPRGSKISSARRNKTAPRRTAPPLTIRPGSWRLISVPPATELFHQARRRQRAGDDTADVDAAP